MPDFSTYAGRQAYRDSHPGVIVDASGASDGTTSSSGSGGGNTGSSSGGGGGGGGGGSTGGVSQQSMYDHLMAVGYNGPTDDASIQAAYARTVNGGNAGSGSGGGGGGDSSSQQQLFNQQAQAAAQSVAQQAAQNAYNQARLALDSAHYANMDQLAKDQLAFQQAVQAYNESITNAGLTGTFNGAPTQAAIAQQAGLTGIYNGQPTEAARQFNVTAGQNAINEQDKTTQDYLSLLSSLKGPANAFQYARTLAGTPNGLQDIVNAAAGRYQMGGNPSGAVSQQSTIGSLLADINNPSGAATGTVNYGQAGSGWTTPNGGMAGMAMLNRSGAAVPNGGMDVTPNGGIRGVQSAAVDPNTPPPASPGSFTPAGPFTQSGPVGGTYTFNGQHGNYAYANNNAASTVATPVDPNARGLPLASQIDTRNFNAMDPTQRSLLWADYQNGGGPGGAMDPLDAQFAYAQSLPRYAGPAGGNVKLFSA